MLKQKKQKILRINIIPLIDIIFLMLVFFMLATNFNRTKEISFSVSNTKQAINESSNQTNLIIKLKDDKLLIKNNIININDLEKNFFAKWNSLDFDRVVILNDKNSSIQSLISLLDLIKKNNITNVNFADEP